MSAVDLFRQIVQQYFKRDASTKSSGMTEDNKYEFFDSSRTDSGFLSGGNIVLSSEIISEEIKAEESDSETVNEDGLKRIEEEVMHLDSGVILTSITESLSDLSLKNSSLNNLDTKPIKPLSRATEEPWEAYFAQDEDGDTSLHGAIIRGFPEAVISIIKAAPLPALLDTQNDDAQSPLHLAAATGQWRIVRWLIVAGAKPCPRNLRGDSPLHVCARIGDLQCIRAVTDPVKSEERDSLGLRYPPQPYQPCDLNQWNYDGQTCVHVAALHGHVNVLRHLEWYGADVNAREGKSGYTALHYAIEQGDEPLTNYLLYESKNLNAAVLTYGGRSVLQLGYPVTKILEEALRFKGAASPYSSDEEYDDDTEDEFSYEPTNIFKPNLVINASA